MDPILEDVGDVGVKQEIDLVIMDEGRKKANVK